MAARCAEIAEAARASLEENWPADDLPIPTFIVDDDWDVDSVEDLNELEGRWVIVSDEDANQVGMLTRAEDEDEYAIAVAFVERYTGDVDDKGKVPKAWKEARKATVQDNIYRYLGNHREVEILDGLDQETCTWSVIMDRVLMRKLKVFASVVDVVFRETRRVINVS
jgi:hypothetical protein